MTQFKAGEGAIKASADIVDDTKGQLTKKLQTLQGQMEQVKQHWEGSGAGAFQSVQTTWTTQAKDVTDVLDIFRENLVKNQKQYTNDDEAASQRLSKYSSQMGAS